MNGGVIILLIVIGLPIYFIPTIIAFNRKHAYKGVVFALNLFGGFTGVLWLVALIWAVYPSEKSLIDPVVGNVTGTGIRNAGDTVGAAQVGVVRGHETEAQLTKEIKEAADLLARGLISDDEFKAIKQKIIGRG